MFTGIIEEIGTIKSVSKQLDSAKITIEAKKVLEDAKLGDSISTNGVCLTVTEFNGSTYSVDVMPETMRKSNLKNLSKGSKVNLERAMLANDRFGGHIVTGHIDGTGTIESFKDEGNAVWVTIKAPGEIIKYIVLKGSITIDGTSLTVAYVDEEAFKVSIIPLTGEKTILLSRKEGEEVNLECDIIGKYVEKLLNFKEGKKASKIDMNFLEQNGFL